MKTRLSSKGFTLVEVLVATGLVAMISLVMTTLMVKMQKDVSVYSAKSGVESMRNQVRMNAINGASILKSASLPQNASFNACLAGTSPCTTSKRDFTIADAMGNIVAGNNVFYDLQGKSCSPWSINCPLKITAQMDMACAGGAPTCVKADTMNVYVNISYHPDLGTQKGVELRPISDTIAVALASYYSVVQSSITNPGANNVGSASTGSAGPGSSGTVMTASGMSCQSGYYMSGIDTNGMVICTAGVAGGSGGGGGGSGSNGRSHDGDGGGGHGTDGGGDGASGAGGTCH